MQTSARDGIAVKECSAIRAGAAILSPRTGFWHVSTAFEGHSSDLRAAHLMADHARVGLIRAPAAAGAFQR